MRGRARRDVDAAGWDERYAKRELVWSVEPNVWVKELTAELTPGRALDLAGGEGRNALWLAEQGWDARVVDFSHVALDRAMGLATDRLGRQSGRLETVCADLLTYDPEPAAFDLVLLVYLHLPERRQVVRAAARAVAPSGHLLVVGHDLDNLAHGVGGPSDPTLLFTPSDVTADLEGTGLSIERAETMWRAVETDDGIAQAFDAVVLARRPPRS